MAININKSLLRQHPIGLGRDKSPRWMVPAIVQQLREYRQLAKELDTLKHTADGCNNLGEIFDEMRRFPRFRAEQIRNEVVPVLALLRVDPPRFLCEIGSGLGGTLFLLSRICHPEALIVTIDLTHSLVRSQINKNIGRVRQRVISIRGDSSQSATVAHLKSVLGENLLDCLFIDGDHSLAGVTADFTNYSPLVRSGGKIVLHDIVPDFKTRFGVNSETWTGGVPQFWTTIADRYSTQEFIENKEQDGYGIGLVHW